MMKKMSYLAAAFVSGVLLSVTINACGGDEKVAPGGTQTPGQNPGGGGNEGGTAGPVNMWDRGEGKLEKRYEYDDYGQEWLSYERIYDSQGRVIGMKWYSISPGITQGKISIENLNYEYQGNECTYDQYVYHYDYETGELISTSCTRYKDVYLE